MCSDILDVAAHTVDGSVKAEDEFTDRSVVHVGRILMEMAQDFWI